MIQRGAIPALYLKQMITFSSVTRYFAAASNDITLGSWYVDEAKAQAAVDSLNHEWNGARTFTLKTWEQDTFTAHQA